ncbi:hypothetical protein NC651_018279 [Populus alba x Populus x berolinensis]|nr:hypothetical protein NC651_018279 [Populus alba x Populus x berolinensis]
MGMGIHLKKADEVLHNESTRLLAFLEDWFSSFPGLRLISHGTFFSIVIMGELVVASRIDRLLFCMIGRIPFRTLLKRGKLHRHKILVVGVKETLLVAREGRVWCLEDRLVLGGFDWDPTLQEKACWSRRPFDRDYNEDGKLSFSEFSDLIKAFGNQVADNKKEELFKTADAVSMDELAELLAFQQENEPLINCCPVCGEILEVSDKLNTLASYGYELPQCQLYELSPSVVSSILMVALLYVSVVTAPMSSINAIAVEAFKKYILVSLLKNRHFSTSLPKYTSSAAQRNLKTLCQIEDGEIYATINQKDGMVRFLKDLEQYKNCEMIEHINSSIQRIMTLSKKLTVVDELLSSDPLYLAKAGRERQRFDFDDFDPVSQKFNI